jgi:hypothetical protein
MNRSWFCSIIYNPSHILNYTLCLF